MSVLDDVLGSSKNQRTQGRKSLSVKDEVLSETSIADYQEPGAFGSFLRWLDRPGQAVGAVLQGDLARAGKQVVDFVGEIPDAVLPGDVIPNATTSRDQMEYSELVGLEDAPWYAKIPVEIALGTALNPLSYLSFGGAGAAPQVAKGLTQAAPLTTKAAAAGGRSADDAFKLITNHALTKSLSRTGEKALKDNPNFIDDLIKQSGNDVDKLQGLVRGDKRFNQGGIQYGLPFRDKTVLRSGEQVGEAVGKAKKAIKDVTPEALQRIGSASREWIGKGIRRPVDAMRSAFGADNPGFLGSLFREASSAGSTSTRSFHEAVIGKLGDLSEAELKAVGDVVDNIKWVDDSAEGLLGNSQKFDASERFDQLIDAASLDKKKVVEAVEEVKQIGEKQWKEWVKEGVVQPRSVWVVQSGKRAGEELTKDELGLLAKQWASDQAMRKSSKSGFTGRREVIDDMYTEGTFSAARNWQTEGLVEVGEAMRGPQSIVDRIYRRLYPSKNVKVKPDDQMKLDILSKRIDIADDMGKNIADVKAGGIVNKFKEAGPSARERYDAVMANLDETFAAADELGISMDDIEALDVLEDMFKRQDELTEALMDNKKFRDWMLNNGFNRVDDKPPANYLQRMFSGQKLDEDGFLVEMDSAITGAGRGGQGSALAKRPLKTDKELLEHLQAKGSVSQFERNAGKRMMSRAMSQGAAVKRARAIRAVLGDEASLTRENVDMVNGIIQALEGAGEHSMANAINNMVSGMPPRNFFLNMLSKTNRVFKPAAVYGIAIPRVSGMTRNRGGGVWQTLSVLGPEAAAANAKRLVPDMIESFAEGINKGFGTKLNTGVFGKQLAAVDEAFANAGGGIDAVRNYIKGMKDLPDRERIIEALDQGVFDTFVTTEGLLKRMAGKKAWADKATDIMDMPGVMFQGLESRMRLAAFLDMRKQGYKAGRAGDKIAETFLDYSVSSAQNRTLRDIIPFAQFTAKTIPQQTKLMAREPATAAAMAQLYGGEKDEVVMPWVADQPSVRVGTTDDGNSLYATGLGLPIEAMNTIPSLSGESMRRNIVGQMHPLLKTGYSFFSGRDPFFNSKWMSYDQTPSALQALGMAERSEFGRYYNAAAGTGMIQPVTSVMNMLNRIADPSIGKGNVITSAINLLTGARVVENDETKAARALLQELVETNPRINTFSVPYTNMPEGSEERGLLQLLKEVQRRQKERDKAKQSAASVGE